MDEILHEGGDLSGGQHSPENEGYYRLSEVADFISIAETLEHIERGDLLTKQELHHAIDLCSKTDPEIVRQNLVKRLAWMEKSGQFAVKHTNEANNQV